MFIMMCSQCFVENYEYHIGINIGFINIGFNNKCYGYFSQKFSKNLITRKFSY